MSKRYFAVVFTRYERTSERVIDKEHFWHWYRIFAVCRPLAQKGRVNVCTRLWSLQECAITRILGPGCARFGEILLSARILWSLCSVDFHTLTLQLPIQTLYSVAPELQVFVSSLKISANEHTPGFLSLSLSQLRLSKI